jgi:hypothetical protein
MKRAAAGKGGRSLETRKNLLHAAMLLLFVTAVACASKNPPLAFAYDHTESFAHLKTYAWYTSTVPHGNSIVDGWFIDRTVREAVDKSLQTKGFHASEDGGADIFVAYQLEDEGVLSQDTFEKTRMTSLWRWNWDHLEYAGTNYLKKSGFLLEIRDRQKRVVWQGVRLGKAGKNPEEIARRIQKSVDVLLSKFPPTNSKQTN